VPAVRFMYENSVPGFVFSASYHCVSALTSAVMLKYTCNKLESNKNTTERTKDFADAGQTAVRSDGSDAGSSMAVALRAGLELGSYTFLASSLQVVGLETVPSDRAGFLIQCTWRFPAHR
jgi:hypothetical protein